MRITGSFKLALTALPVLLCTVRLLTAAEYYVDSFAADGGDGSIGSPWNRIEEVNGFDQSPGFQAGDAIYLRKGSVWFESALTLSSSGAPTNPIVVDAYPAASPDPRPAVSAGRLLPRNDGWIYNATYDEYSMPIGGSIEFNTNVPVVVRGDIAEPAGLVLLRGVGIPDRSVTPLIPQGAYYAKNINSDKWLFYRPEADGVAPNAFDFVVSIKPHAVQVSGDYVTVRNISGFVSGFSKPVTDADDTVLVRGYSNAVFEAAQRDTSINGQPRGVVFEDCEARFGSTFGVSIWGADSVIRRCVAVHNRSTGVYLLGSEAVNGTVEDSQIAYNGNINFGKDDRGGIGVQAAYATIRGNHVHNNGNPNDPKYGSDAAISLFASPHALIEANLIRNSTRTAIVAKNALDPSGDADVDSFGHTIRYNIIHNWNLQNWDDDNVTNISGIALQARGNGLVESDPNYIPGNMGRHKVYNNTLVSDRVSDAPVVGIALYLSGLGNEFGDRFMNTYVRNNIAHVTGSRDPRSAGLFIAGEPEAPANHTKYINVAVDHNLVDVDPRFADPVNRDFHLAPESPAIGTGFDVGLTEDFESTQIVGRPDIGALESPYEPVISEALPNSIDRGATLEVVISGGGFQPGAALTIVPDDKVSIGNPVVDTSTTLRALVSVSRGAHKGARDVVVTNPDGRNYTLTGGLLIR
jgi:hypothetical protein